MPKFLPSLLRNSANFPSQQTLSTKESNVVSRAKNSGACTNPRLPRLFSREHPRIAGITIHPFGVADPIQSGFVCFTPNNVVGAKSKKVFIAFKTDLRTIEFADEKKKPKIITDLLELPHPPFHFSNTLSPVRHDLFANSFKHLHCPVETPNRQRMNG